MKKVVIILGPTAVGKSDVAVELAKLINGEIISADSSQVFRGFNIGSGKITYEEMQNIPHHLIDILNFDEDFNVAVFKQMAETSIQDIQSRGKNAIICGGTGLYVKALIKGYTFFKVSRNKEYRKELESLAEEKGLQFLHDMLYKLDSERASKIHANDKIRIIRSLEILNQGGKEILVTPKYQYITIILNQDRQKLYERINLRVDKMVENGLFSEVETLIKQGANTTHSSFKSIGYKEIYDYIANGNMSKEETIELIKKHARNYAKRQLTYLRALKNSYWFENNNSIQTANAIFELINKIN